MPSTFTLHELTGGVWMAEAHGTASVAVSNAALIDLGDRTVVVDTFMTARAAEELASESTRLTGRAPFLVLNTHWHSDHTGGNRVFQDAGIVGTSVMRDLIAGDAPSSRAEFEEKASDIRNFAAEVASNARSDEDRSKAIGLTKLADALTADENGHHDVLPSLLIGDRLDLEGERRATILGFGKGHTESDLFLHLPDDDIVIAGDLVWRGVHPKTTDGFPAPWAESLEKMANLGASRVVPSHGPPGTAEDIGKISAYMRELAALVDEVRSGGAPAADVDVPTGSEEWRDPARFTAELSDLAGR